MPLLSDASAVQKLLTDSPLSESLIKVELAAEMIIDRLERVGCKTALRLAELAVMTAGQGSDATKESVGEAQIQALAEILDDLAGDEVSANQLCEVL